MITVSDEAIDQHVSEIITENARRNAAIYAKFNPITGEGSLGDRVKLFLSDFPLPTQFVPKEMMKVPLVRQLAEAGSVEGFLKGIYGKKAGANGANGANGSDGRNGSYEEDREKVIEQFIRVRMRFDFAFWAAAYIYIKPKGEGGEDILFRLNRAQRRLVLRFEKRRIAGKPIRLILLKARQWGGSTVTQIYMAWLQLVHKTGLNSLIVGHVKDTSNEVKDMFDRMITHYPVRFLHKLGEAYDENEAKIVGVGNSGNIHRIPQRNFKIKIGTAERPDSARGGDYNLVHCTEVALWKKTDGKTPEQIIKSATSGILLKPYTMIVYESTANGTGNFFQREYDAAKNGTSQFEAMFVPWYEIEWNALPLTDAEAFARWLYVNRNNENAASNREEPGKYLWWLWTLGATLEAIHWYIQERSKYTDHGDMASECPSDDEEAFVHSGARVFDKYKVNKLKPSCRAPRYVGDLYGDGDKGKACLAHLRFEEDHQGQLWVWSKPEVDEEEEVTDRYLVVVDIGGRSYKADWSVIVVFDRLYMMDGDKPSVVAQWYGHIDHDLLAWKAAQVAAWYDNALLVIESNTLETKDKERDVDGDQASFILNQIKDIYENLYERHQTPEDIAEGAPRKYGFHTNVATKPMIISTLVKVIREALYTERDERCLDEYLTYEKKQNGSFGAIAGKHDDLLMTRAIGLPICFYEMPMPTVRKRLRSQRVQHKKAVSEATIG